MYGSKTLIQRFNFWVNLAKLTTITDLELNGRIQDTDNHFNGIDKNKLDC